MTDINDRWMQDFHVAGRTLRMFFKPWAKPYCWSDYGLWAFGLGPFGFMFWPKRDEGKL